MVPPYFNLVKLRGIMTHVTRYWHVYYCSTDKRYKLRQDASFSPREDTLASFRVFDMAYDYVNRMNNTNIQSYSRWTR